MRKMSAQMRDFRSPSGLSRPHPADELAELVEEDAAWEHAGGLFVVYEVASDDMTDRLGGNARCRLMTDSELRAKHPRLAGSVDRSQRPFPETATCGKK